MPNPENIKDHEFKPGKSGNPHGRPKKLLGAITKQLEAEGYQRVKAANIVEAYELLMNMDEARIKEYVQDKDAPMFLRIVARSMLDKKGVEMLEMMLDRAHGRSTQTVKLNVGKVGKDLRDETYE